MNWRKLLASWAELQALKDETAREFAELQARLEAALEGLRATRLEFLNYKALVVQDRAQLAEIDRLRQLTKAQLVQFDASSMMLH